MKKKEFFIVILLSLLASWWYFYGTPFILGLDYFTHLSEVHVIKQAIQEGVYLPAWNFFYGCGETFIRYQAMLSIQIMGWMSLVLQKIFFLSDTQSIVYTGRIFCVLLNILTGLLCYYSFKKWIPSSGAALAGTAAYLLGWQRLGEILHVGAIPRAFAFSFYPLCFSFFLLFWKRGLSKKEYSLMILGLSCCLLGHPGVFFFLMLLFLIYSVVEIALFPLRKKESLEIFPKKGWALMIFFPIGLCAWYLLPAIIEKQYYGQSRILQKKEQETPIFQTIPLTHIKEFSDRNAWFGNHQVDSQKGGSRLADQTGVNSAYLGISVLLLALLSPLVFLANRSLGYTCLRLLLCAFFLLVLVFWEGIRYKLFYSLGHQVFLTCRYLGVLYFTICLLASLGSYGIFLFLQKKKIQYAEGIFFLFVFCISYDFLSLIQKKNSYPEVCYKPQQGIHDAIGIAKISYALDSYDFLKKTIYNPGRCLELPLVNCYANSIYAGLESPVALENSTVWEEGISFERSLFPKEISDAILQYPLEYSNFHDCYGFQKENFRYDSRCIALQENDMVFKSLPGWSGATKISISLSVPLGKYSAMLCLPMYIPENSEALVLQNSKMMGKAQGDLSGKTFFVTLPLEATQGKSNLEIQIQLGKNKKSFILGHPVPPFVLYSGMSLGYRLALLDIRFLVFNLGYYKTSLKDFPENSWLKKLYQSSTSVLYENQLSTPFLFPRKTYLLQGKGIANFFNSFVCHHPLYDPHLACFCYEGQSQEFDGILSSQDPQCQKILAKIFEPCADVSTNTATLIHKKTHSILLEMDIKKKGFFFPSLRYHPNLKASQDGKNIPIYLSQAGMLSLLLPQGKYSLEIAYHQPWYDIAGKTITIVFFLIFLVYFLKKQL